MENLKNTNLKCKHECLRGVAPKTQFGMADALLVFYKNKPGKCLQGIILFSKVDHVMKIKFMIVLRL